VVARNRIRCTVVAVAVSNDHCTSRGALARDILPGADPYVAQLIRKLQDEVREERRLQSLVRRYRPGRGEAAPRSRERFEFGDVLDSFAGN
jgi:hypothetical protein